MEEANLAKERLQGKLFSDPRILITFSPNDPTANQTGGLPYQAPQLNVSGQHYCQIASMDMQFLMVLEDPILLDRTFVRVVLIQAKYKGIPKG